MKRKNKYSSNMAGFFNMFSNFLGDLADPKNNQEDVMKGFWMGLIRMAINAIAMLFKPFLGPNSEEKVNTFVGNADKVMTRFVEPFPPASQQTPQFTPGFSSAQSRGDEGDYTIPEYITEVSPDNDGGFFPTL